MPTEHPPLTAHQLMGALQYSIRKLGTLTPSIGGRISFVLIDDRPHAWLLDLDPPGGAWIQGHERVAAALAGGELSAAICAKTDAFRALLIENREVDPADLAVFGDRAKLARLGELMGKSGSAIEQRAAGNKRSKKNRRKR